ncbi:MAG: lipopolysaccharide biosynthesis protein [Planctomycetes bacterium]|nr:lipopolysaccharide biosynthesis protein [Planctomycetota bacterium]
MRKLQLEPPANLNQEPGAGLAEPGRGESLQAEPDNLRRQAVRGGVIVMVSRLGTQGFVWVSTLLVMRFLKPDDVGIMTWGMVFVGLADLLAEAGVGRALIQKKDLTPRDLDEGFSLTLLLSLGGYAVLFALADPAEGKLGISGFAFFLRILALHLFLIPIRAIPLALLDRHMLMGKQSLIHVASAVLQAALVLTLAISGLGYWSQVIGTLIGRGLEACALLWISGYRPRLAMLGSRARGLIAFGVHVSLGSLLWFIYSNADFAIVGWLIGATELGIYALAFQLISMPAEKITANLNKVVYPVFCRLQNDPDRLRDWSLRLMTLLGFFGMPVMAGMVLVAEDGIVAVLTEKWRPAVLPFQLLALSGLIKLYAAALPPLYNAIGRPDISMKYTAFCTLVFPAFFVIAGRIYGLNGICLVWTIVFPPVVIGLIHVTRHLTGFGLWDVLRTQGSMVIGVLFMAGVVLGVQWLTGDWPRSMRLAAAIVAGMAAYPAAMLILARRTVLAQIRATFSGEP